MTSSLSASTTALTPARRRQIEAMLVRAVGEHDDRALQMAHAYGHGATLEQIGDRWGVTRERVRQIINADSGYTAPELAQHRRLKAAEEKQFLKASVLAWSEANPGVDLHEGARRFCLERDEFKKLLGRRARFHEASAMRKSFRSGASDEQLLQYLRRFHAETGATTAAAYTAWAKQEGVPGHQTVATRFGRWKNALTAAGIRRAEPVRRESVFTDDDLWAAAMDAFASPEAPVTYREFSEWLQAREGMPSDVLIRNRLQVPFSTLRHAAVRMLATGEVYRGVCTGNVFESRDWKSLAHRDDDPLEPVRGAIADLGPKLTNNAYTVWAKENRAPSALTLMRRTRLRWGALVEAAGGQANHRRNNGYSDQDLVDWVRRFIAEVGSTSSSAYAEWQQGKSAPHLVTVLARFGSWAEALEAAEEQAPSAA